MNDALPSALEVFFTSAFFGLFIVLFAYGSWIFFTYRGSYVVGGRLKNDNTDETKAAGRHQRRCMLVFVLAAVAFVGMIASSPEGREEFCRRTSVWPGCSNTR